MRTKTIYFVGDVSENNWFSTLTEAKDEVEERYSLYINSDDDLNAWYEGHITEKVLTIPDRFESNWEVDVDHANWEIDFDVEA